MLRSSRYKLAAAFVLPLLLSACGGGSGSGSNSLASDADTQDDVPTTLSERLLTNGAEFWRCSVGGLVVQNTFNANGTGFSEAVSSGVADSRFSWSQQSETSINVDFPTEPAFILFDISFGANDNRFSAQDSRGLAVSCTRDTD